MWYKILLIIGLVNLFFSILVYKVFYMYGIYDLKVYLGTLIYMNSLMSVVILQFLLKR